jgi:carbon-monoxide dehydrogenase medium subunit
MIPVQFDYVAPNNIEEAVAQLKHNENASILAGGLSLLTAMKLRRIAPTMLVDLRKISDLSGINHREAGGSLQIGAMTTYAEIAATEDVKEHYHALADAIDSIGDPQVRNRGTIGGSLSYNNPAADLTAVALVLEATINTIGPDGTRAIPVDEFIVGAFKTSLKPAEIITSVDFPTYVAGTGIAYEKFKNPASGFAICGVAAMIEKAPDGTVGKCRVAVTGATDYALRLRKVEAAMEGKELTQENLAAEGRVTNEGLTFLSDFAASAEYRAHLTEVLVERTISCAATRASFRSRYIL